jgi:hypothetical protein
VTAAQAPFLLLLPSLGQGGSSGSSSGGGGSSCVWAMPALAAAAAAAAGTATGLRSGVDARMAAVYFSDSELVPGGD